MLVRKVTLVRKVERKGKREGGETSEDVFAGENGHNVTSRHREHHKRPEWIYRQPIQRLFFCFSRCRVYSGFGAKFYWRSVCVYSRCRPYHRTGSVPHGFN